MIEVKTIDYTRAVQNELDIDKLSPVEGKVLLTKGRPPMDAIYFQNPEGEVIAYLTFTPCWGSREEVVVESFTNEAYRHKGLQDRLNSYLIRLLRSQGVKKMIGQIMMDNSRSLLNRLSTKDPDSHKVLKADILELDDIDISQPIQPTSLNVVLDLNETVDSNEDLLQRLVELQTHLTEFRMGPRITEIRK